MTAALPPTPEPFTAQLCVENLLCAGRCAWTRGRGAEQAGPDPCSCQTDIVVFLGFREEWGLPLSKTALQIALKTLLALPWLVRLSS